MSAALESFGTMFAERPRMPGPMAALRGAAMERFMQLGLPGPREESWRASSLRALAMRRFRPAAALPAGVLPPPFAPAPSQAFPTLRLNNGAADLGAQPMPAAVLVRSLREFEAADPAGLAARLPAPSEREHLRFGLLNAALFDDGLYIRVRESCAQPLLLLHTAGGGETGAAIHPRLIIEIDAGCSATIVEVHQSAAGAAVFSNSAASIRLGGHARLEHFRIFALDGAATQIDELRVWAGAGACLRQHSVCLGGGWVRATLDVELEGPQASLDGYALLAGHDARHADLVNVVTHAAPHTFSRQTARAVASGRSRMIVNSKVVVAKDAQKADSRQSCRGLLLSAGAQIDTRPQLEIHADDVKCAHGATTGRLDADMLFYLLSRGLDRATAQSLLVFAFVADALTGMSVPEIRAAIESALIAQLPDSQLLRQFR